MRNETAIAAGLICCSIIIGGIAIIKLQNSDSATPQQLTKLTTPPIRITDPTQGPEKAPVTIVVYADFACDSCGGLATELSNLRHESEIGNKFRVIWKDFPIHQQTLPKSFDLHIAARCAATMGKFWEFHDAVFAHANQLIFGTDILSAVEQESGVSPSRIADCMKSSAITDLINQNMADGRALGITALPTYFINGNRNEGVLPYNQLRGIIRSEIATYDASHP